MCKKTRLAKSAYKEIDFNKQQYNLVAIIERGGRILSIGLNNMSRGHPAYFNGEFDKGIHAEFSALNQTRDASGADIHVFRFKRNGDHGDSKPCKHCMATMRSAGIKRVFYWKNGEHVTEKLYG
jgi:deoxycytidylate deaminase